MIQLYPYQQEAHRLITDFFSLPANRRLLFVMPTGTGKTTVFSSWIEKQYALGQHALAVVHRIELVDQIHARIKSLGVDAGIIASDYPSQRHHRVQVASIQTLSKRQCPPADWVIIDEAHHCRADSYERLLGIYPKAKFIGFTATPVRLDGKGFDEYFQSLISLHSLAWYFERKYLVRPQHLVCTFPNEKIPVAKTGDYDLDVLGDLMMDDKYIHNPLQAYQTHAMGRKAIVFCVNRKHSELVAADFCNAGIPAVHLDGETPKDLRASYLNEFKTGLIKVIVNYDIVGEGLDVPDVEVVVLHRRTKSLSLYLQWVGRAIRTAKGKTTALVLDCAGLWLEHKALAGDDFDWTMTTSEAPKRKPSKEISDTLKQIEVPNDFKEPIFGVNKSGELVNLSASEETCDGLLVDDSLIQSEIELMPIGNELRRLVVFEAFLYKAQKKNNKALSAVYQYKDYLSIQKASLTQQEINYCRSRISSLGVAVKDGFWYYLGKS
ncbi:MAG: DEAD/DEAH box helicase [Cytophagales bacterium]|nr:DEAD/DEAH box helicase [Cytophagales bacterium]